MHVTCRKEVLLTFLDGGAQLAQLGADGVHALCLLDPPIAYPSDGRWTLCSTRGWVTAVNTGVIHTAVQG